MNILQTSGLGVPEVLFIAMALALVLSSVVIGRWGESKGKTFWEGFLLSLFISPVVGALVVALTGTAANHIRVSRP